MDVTKLLDGMLDRENELSPVSATFKGLHDYDELWDDPGPEGEVAWLAYLDEYIPAVERAAETASGDDALDLRLAHARLANYDVHARGIQDQRKNPLGVPATVVNAAFVMLVREYAPLKERLGAVRARLEKVPAYCARAKRLFERPVDRFTALADEMVKHSGAFLTQVIPAAATGDAAGYADGLRAAGEKAAAALDDFIAHVKRRPQSPAFAAGRANFNRLLQEHHLLPFDATSLRAFGEDQFRKLQREIKEVAWRIDPKKTPLEIIADLKHNHPRADGVLAFYRDWMEKARRFVLDKNLCGIPPREELEVIETPAFERATIPFAAYMSPACYEPRQNGFFYVTPVDPQAPPEEQEQKLQGHSADKVPVTALHEGYPGHHLQLCWANRQTRRIRKEGDSNVTVEGWALYCEEMMREQGFYADDRIILGQKRDLLWRAVRVIVDAGLHAFDLPFDAAVNMLIEKVGMERVNAEAEVKRYVYTPTQPMSYLVGKELIMRLRADFMKKNAGAAPRLFHDRVLSCGSQPAGIVREMVLA